DGASLPHVCPAGVPAGSDRRAGRGGRPDGRRARDGHVDRQELAGRGRPVEAGPLGVARSRARRGARPSLRAGSGPCAPPRLHRGSACVLRAPRTRVGGRMSVVFTAEELAFRSEVRGFIAEQGELIGPRQFYAGRGGATRELYRRLGGRGWLSLTWPSRFGG